MSRRELIVSGPTDDPRVAEQVDAVRGDPNGASERELDVAHREAETFGVELRGKDGQVRARWGDTVGVSELWARIDAFPSRRRVLRDQRSGPV
jgi:hypothetical protein